MRQGDQALLAIQNLKHCLPGLACLAHVHHSQAEDTQIPGNTHKGFQAWCMSDH